MKFMVPLLAFLGYVVLAKSSFDELSVHPGVGGLYKGPNSETIIKGPDGSVITAETAGGVIKIQSDVKPDLAKDPVILQPIIPNTEIFIAPETVSGTTEIAPVIATVTAAPVIHTIEVVQQDPRIIETEIVDAPEVETQQVTDLVGPSGRISTRGSSSVVSGPASTTISKPAKVLTATSVVAAVPVIASVQTPLRAGPVSEVISDISKPSTSFVLQPTHPPPISRARISSDIIGSTLSPESTGQVLASTLTPSRWNIVPIPVPTVSSSTAANSLIESQQHLLPLGTQRGASIKSASSFGVIENLGDKVQISSTIHPEISIVSTVVPTVSKGKQNSLNYALINSRQLSINPSLIAPANIIPPEIGLGSKSIIDLETTVTVSSTANPLPTIDASNVEIIDDAVADNVEDVDGRVNQVQTIPGKNQGIGVYDASQTVPLAVNVPPNVSSPGIHPDGLVGSVLTKYGTDPSQINLAQVPLSTPRLLSPSRSVSSSLDKEIADVSSNLWNKYTRAVEN